MVRCESRCKRRGEMNTLMVPLPRAWSKYRRPTISRLTPCPCWVVIPRVTRSCPSLPRRGLLDRRPPGGLPTPSPPGGFTLFGLGYSCPPSRWVPSGAQRHWRALFRGERVCTHRGGQPGTFEVAPGSQLQPGNPSTCCSGARSPHQIFQSIPTPPSDRRGVSCVRS